MLKRFFIGFLFLTTTETIAEDYLFEAEQWDEMNTYLNQSLGDTIESILEGNPKFEPLLTYGKESPIRRLSRPVGKLRIRFESGKFTSCTATLVSRNRLITNNHCVPGTGVNGPVVQASLEMGYYDVVRSDEYTRFNVEIVPVFTSKQMDVSILSLGEEAGEKYGWTEIASLVPKEGDNLTVVHHPGGYVKHVTRGGCISGPIVDQKTAKIAHKCDTLPGSSGAPIFDANNKLIAIHCCGTTVRGSAAYNFGRLNALIPQLSSDEWLSDSAEDEQCYSFMTGEDIKCPTSTPDDDFDFSNDGFTSTKDDTPISSENGSNSAFQPAFD